MAINTHERTNILKLTVGLFNAAPGANYLSEFTSVFEANGHNYGALALTLGTTGAFQSLYPNFQTASEFAAKFLATLGLQGNTEAVDFVTAKFNAGVPKAQIIYDALVALDASTSAEFADARAILDNKAAVAENYSVTLGASSTSLATLQGAVANVTADAASVTAANAANAGGNGQTFTLTVNQDSLTGTAGNDTFNAGAAQDGAGTLINTLQNVDVIDGGAGTDTLAVTHAAAATVAATIKNIENINVRFADAKADLNLGNATGVTTINVADSTTAGVVTGVGAVGTISVKSQNQNASFDGSTATTLALTLDTFGKSTASNTVDLGTVAAAKATTLNATLNNAYAIINSTAADAVTTLSIAATGTNTLSLVDSGAKVTAATVTGAGSVDLTATALTGALTKFDGAAATGAIKVAIQSSKAAVITTGSGADVVDVDTTVTAQTTVDTGAGNDAVYVGALLGSFKSVAGGEGTDIINITDADTWTTANAALISGFETLDVSGGSNGKGAGYDQALVAFSTVQIDEAINGTLVGNVTLTNVADTSTLNIASKAKTDANFTTTKDVTVTLKDAAGTTAKGTAESTTVNVTINDGNKDDAADGNVTIVKYTAAGVENVTVNSVVGTTDGGTTGVKDNAYSTIFTAAVLDSVETLTLTGTTDIVFNALTNTGNTLTKVNAGAASGDITLNASAITTQVAYTGSSGVDTYTATNGGSIYGGAGNDQITLTAAGAGGKADTIILKAAGDVSFKDANADSKIDAAAVETITNFITAAAAVANTEEADVLDVTTFAFSGYARSAVNKGALANSVEGGSFATSITDFFADAAGDRGVAYGTNGGATYVFVDADKDGNWSSATDVAIKLAGVIDFAVTSLAL